MNIEPIDDVDSTEEYIKELEAEITSLQSSIKKLNKVSKPKQQDISCCEAYKLMKVNFHKLLDEIIPF